LEDDHSAAGRSDLVGENLEFRAEPMPGDLVLDQLLGRLLERLLNLGMQTARKPGRQMAWSMMLSAKNWLLPEPRPPWAPL